MEKSAFEELLDSMKAVKERLRFCKICFSLTEDETCDICSSSKRSNTIICLVEQPEDVYFIENTGEYKGKYHVLGGVISPLDGVGPEQLKIKELLIRLSEPIVEELLIATNPTLEGDATASYISGLLKNTGVKVTRIAHGVTIGSTLEYADQYTLAKAIKSRLII